MLLTVAYFAYLDIKHFGDAVVAPLAYGVILISSPRPPNLAVKVSPYSITDRSVPELIPVLGSQPAGDVNHKPAVGCHYFPPGLQLLPQPLRGLLSVSLLGEQRHHGCEQFALGCYPTTSRLRFEPGPFCA